MFIQNTYLYFVTVMIPHGIHDTSVAENGNVSSRVDDTSQNETAIPTDTTSCCENEVHLSENNGDEISKLEKTESDREEMADIVSEQQCLNSSEICPSSETDGGESENKNNEFIITGVRSEADMQTDKPTEHDSDMRDDDGAVTDGLDDETASRDDHQPTNAVEETKEMNERSPNESNRDEAPETETNGDDMAADDVSQVGHGMFRYLLDYDTEDRNGKTGTQEVEQKQSEEHQQPDEEEQQQTATDAGEEERAVIRAKNSENAREEDTSDEVWRNEYVVEESWRESKSCVSVAGDSSVVTENDKEPVNNKETDKLSETVQEQTTELQSAEKSGTETETDAETDQERNAPTLDMTAEDSEPVTQCTTNENSDHVESDHKNKNMKDQLGITEQNAADETTANSTSECNRRSPESLEVNSVQQLDGNPEFVEQIEKDDMQQNQSVQNHSVDINNSEHKIIGEDLETEMIVECTKHTEESDVEATEMEDEAIRPAENNDINQSVTINDAESGHVRDNISEEEELQTEQTATVANEEEPGVNRAENSENATEEDTSREVWRNEYIVQESWRECNSCENVAGDSSVVTENDKELVKTKETDQLPETVQEPTSEMLRSAEKSSTETVTDSQSDQERNALTLDNEKLSTTVTTTEEMRESTEMVAADKLDEKSDKKVDEGVEEASANQYEKSTNDRYDEVAWLTTQQSCESSDGKPPGASDDAGQRDDSQEAEKGDAEEDLKGRTSETSQSMLEQDNGTRLLTENTTNEMMGDECAVTDRETDDICEDAERRNTVEITERQNTLLHYEETNSTTVIESQQVVASYTEVRETATADVYEEDVSVIAVRQSCENSVGTKTLEYVSGEHAGDNSCETVVDRSENSETAEQGRLEMTVEIHIRQATCQGETMTDQLEAGDRGESEREAAEHSEVNTTNVLDAEHPSEICETDSAKVEEQPVDISELGEDEPSTRAVEPGDKNTEQYDIERPTETRGNCVTGPAEQSNDIWASTVQLTEISLQATDSVGEVDVDRSERQITESSTATNEQPEIDETDDEQVAQNASDYTASDAADKTVDGVADDQEDEDGTTREANYQSDDASEVDNNQTKSRDQHITHQNDSSRSDPVSETTLPVEVMTSCNGTADTLKPDEGLGADTVSPDEFNAAESEETSNHPTGKDDAERACLNGEHDAAMNSSDPTKKHESIRSYVDGCRDIELSGMKLATDQVRHKSDSLLGTVR